MSLTSVPVLIDSAKAPARLRVALLLVGATLAAAFAAFVTGFVQLPDLEAVLTDVSSTLGTWTYALVAGLAFLETGAFVGLVAPGETAIALGGVVAAEGDVELALMLPIAWVAAALGDLASFWLGTRLGRRFLVAHGPRLGVTAPRLERVEGFFARHGPKAILLGRFIGIVRAGVCWAPRSGPRRSRWSATPSTTPSPRLPRDSPTAHSASLCSPRECSRGATGSARSGSFRVPVQGSHPMI
ncbi:MAG: DedA family protein [Actinomycetota bacterium]|nr:DedA family protein [Actinomycetota bacterium]